MLRLGASELGGTEFYKILAFYTVARNCAGVIVRIVKAALRLINIGNIHIKKHYAVLVHTTRAPTALC